MKKRKSDTSQPIKKGKGKQIDSSSKTEEVSESDDEEIEAMFDEASNSESENGPSRLRTEDFIVREV